MSVSCGACGKEWDRHPALLIGCPKCTAAAGEPCIRPSGHSGPFIEPHVARKQAAVDAGVLGMCPEGPTAKATRCSQADQTLQIALL